MHFPEDLEEALSQFTKKEIKVKRNKSLNRKWNKSPNRKGNKSPNRKGEKVNCLKKKKKAFLRSWCKIAIKNLLIVVEVRIDSVLKVFGPVFEPNCFSDSIASRLREFSYYCSG